ncbi:hypothetical protein PGT21_012850 [Puccinia graminis f. sp. tritici]|uniref:Uncharacterized protein n=1 Tax=Puccinia graminis f. sp. tritici TaxID=56615 RepID=A0A5B0LRV0_PUCGR|nr:hypothetical protein PGTUg99_022990 [Puccinia graminis f. sp. tritici]KAA1071606.1 hypothetical protein PGT21_012850 [Puccinia graminis f. sp. tritici]
MELSRIRELSEESSRGSSGLRGGCDSRIQEYFHGDPETYPVKAYLPEDDPSDSVSPVPSPQPKPLRNRPPSKNHGDWQWERLSELYGPNSRLGRSTSPLKNDRSSKSELRPALELDNKIIDVRTTTPTTSDFDYSDTP